MYNYLWIIFILIVLSIDVNAQAKKDISLWSLQRIQQESGITLKNFGKLKSGKLTFHLIYENREGTLTTYTNKNNPISTYYLKVGKKVDLQFLFIDLDKIFYIQINEFGNTYIININKLINDNPDPNIDLKYQN